MREAFGLVSAHRSAFRHAGVDPKTGASYPFTPFVPFSPLFPIRQHAQKPRPLDRVLQHLLMLEARTRVVTVPDVPKVIDERLEGRIIFVIEVQNAFTVEGAALLDVHLGLLRGGHRGGGTSLRPPEADFAGQEIENE